MTYDSSSVRKLREYEESPCDVLRRPDGQPEFALPRQWSGLPLGLYNIPGSAERGAFETSHPTLLVARRGEGRRAYRSAGRTRQLKTAPGMIELYPRGLEFDRMTWEGQAGDCIGIHLVPDAMQCLAPTDRADLVREHEVFDAQLQWLAVELLNAARTGRPDMLYVEGLSLAMLGRLRQRGSLASFGRPQLRRKNGRLSEVLQRRLVALIAETPGADLTVARLAREAHMSPDHFAGCFKRSFDMTPHRFVQQQRIVEGRRLLRGSDLPIAQIALTVGFASQAHFTQVFRQHTGVTPARWRLG